MPQSPNQALMPQNNPAQPQPQSAQGFYQNPWGSWGGPGGGQGGWGGYGGGGYGWGGPGGYGRGGYGGGYGGSQRPWWMQMPPWLMSFLRNYQQQQQQPQLPTDVVPLPGPTAGGPVFPTAADVPDAIAGPVAADVPDAVAGPIAADVPDAVVPPGPVLGGGGVEPPYIPPGPVAGDVPDATLPGATVGTVVGGDATTTGEGGLTARDEDRNGRFGATMAPTGAYAQGLGSIGGYTRGNRGF